MPVSNLENEKDALIKILTDSYAQGRMDMSAFEGSVTRISACADHDALVSDAASLGLALPALPPEPLSDAVELTCVSASLRKSGDWVKSRSYRLALKSSSSRLDLREYGAATGFRLHIDLCALSSTFKLIVPRGFEVEDRFTERVSSVVGNKPKRGAFGDNRVVLTGSLKSSTVRIKYR